LYTNLIKDAQANENLPYDARNVHVVTESFLVLCIRSSIYRRKSFCRLEVAPIVHFGERPRTMCTLPIQNDNGRPCPLAPDSANTSDNSVHMSLYTRMYGAPKSHEAHHSSVSKPGHVNVMTDTQHQSYTYTY